MADISKIKLPNNSTYNLAVYTDHIKPMMSKTYTGVIGTANDWANSTFFYGKVHPTDFNAIWRIHYKIEAVCVGQVASQATYDVTIKGSGSSLISYTVFNAQKNTSYRPLYYQVLYRAKSAGITSGYGHLIGTRLYSSWNPTTAANSRTFVFDILSCDNCTFTFFDSPVKYSSAPGTGSTNYDTYSEIDGFTNGLASSGVRNDPNYQNRIYYTSSTAAETIYRYQLVLRTPGGRLLPVSSANNTFTIGKTYSSSQFDPFGEIYYYNATSTVNANANLDNSVLYRQLLVDLRYAFDLNGTASYRMIARQPVYLTATPLSNGMAVLTEPTGSVIGPLSQVLPVTDDGLIYIYLGQAYEDSNPYRVELTLHHPVYWYKNGAVRKYRPTVNGHTVNADVPSGAKFTDTKYTASTSKLVTTTVPNVTNKGTVPSLTITSTACDDITGWTTNTPTSASVSGGILTISIGTAADLDYTARSVGSASGWNAGTTPTLGTAITVATGSLASNGGGGTVATGITAS